MSVSPYYRPRKYAASTVPETAREGEPLPVLVVGGGPVGLATAAGLALRGVPVTVLHADDQVSFGSRAICVSRHSLEIAERLGFGAELEQAALPWAGGRSFYRDTEVLHFRMPYSEHDVRAPMVNVPQSELEQILVDHLLADPLVTVLWKVEVTGLEQDEDGVTVHVRTVAGPRTLRAAWIVAADGGRSRMRELLGLTLEGTSYEGRYVIADIHWKSDLPAERRVWFDPPSNPGSTVIMHRQPRDIWRIDYQVERGEAEEAIRPERIEARIAEHLDWLGNREPWTLEWSGVYTAHARALDDFLHGRVLFAGDAAHLVPIFGVRGLNSGLEDADTLGWMLAAVVHGRADPALLGVYSTERRSAWEQNVSNAAKSTRMMTPGTEGYRATRAAILRLATVSPEYGFLLNPRQSSATHAHTSPLTWHAAGGVTGALPGDPLPDRRIATVDGEATSVNRVRGTGFALLAFGGPLGEVDAVTAAAARLREALAPERLCLVLVNPVPAGAAPTSSGQHGTAAGDDRTAAGDDGTAAEDDRTAGDDRTAAGDDGTAAGDDRTAAGNDRTAAGDDGITTVCDEGLQRDLGARAGEVFVVRPDGVLLARLRDLVDLDRLPAVVRSGRAPSGGSVAPEWADPTPPADRHLESVWLALSDALDRAGADDREGFLVRLALLLASHVPASRFSAAIASALAEGPGS